MVSSSFWKCCTINISVVAVSLLIISCSDTKKTAQQEPTTVKYANENIEPKRATLQAELEIGQNESVPYVAFNRVLDVKTDENGNLYVLDGGEDHIVKLSSQGEYLTTIGKKGKGPGEFENALFFDMAGDGGIYVYDLALRRISIFNNQYEYLSSFSVEEPVGDLVVDIDGNIFLLLREPYEKKGTSAYLWKYLKEKHYAKSNGKLLLTHKITYEIGPPPGDIVVSTMDKGPAGELLLCFFNDYCVRKFTQDTKLINAFARKLNKLKLPDFWRQDLEKKKANAPEELRDRYKIPEKYPNVVEKLLVDPTAEKVYVITAEWIKDLKFSQNLFMPEYVYIDQYDMDGNLKERFKVKSQENRMYNFRDVKDGKFICIVVDLENDFLSTIVRCVLNY